jgi:hypothetical protein
MRKLGPLPLWAWMGIGLGVALAFSLWEKNKKAAASSSQSSSSGSTGAASTTASGTPSDLIPQFVNQVFQSPSPPPDVTVTNQQTVTNPPPTTPPPTSPPPKTVQRPQPTQEAQYPAPSGFQSSKLSGTSIRLKWNAESDLYGNPSATYTWVVKDSQGNTKTGTTSGTTATVSGLKPNTGYSTGVYVTQDSTHQNGAPTYSYTET